MDEIQIAMLQANGYDYIHGAIVDAEGNYLSSLELKGQTLESESDESLFKEGMALLKEDNEAANNILILDEYEFNGESYNTEQKEDVKTTITLVDKGTTKHSIKSQYKYPLALASTIIIYLLIKSQLSNKKETKINRIFNLILVLSVACAFGGVLGFYFKYPSATLLRNALSKSTQWKKDLFLEWVRSKTTFFQLDGKGYGDFEFNWVVFSIVVITVLLLYLLAKRTTVIELLKSRIKPYLK